MNIYVFNPSHWFDDHGHQPPTTTPKFYRSFFQNKFELHHILSTVLSHGEKSIGNGTPSSLAFDGVGGNPQHMNKEPHDVLVTFLVGMINCPAIKTL